MVNINFQVGRFPVPYRFFNHFLDLRVIFMEMKGKTFVRFSQSTTKHVLRLISDLSHNIIVINTLFEIGKIYIALEKIYGLIYTN